jgi:hypothetical protein
MTGIRRSLLLLALTVAVVIGGLGPAHPAQASFSKTATAATMQLQTATVTAPTSVTATLTCTRSGGTLAASWPASTTARVDGYLITVVFSDGFTQQADSMVTGTTWSTPMSLYNATNYSMHVTVSTHTNYGWTSAPVSSLDVRC